MTETNRSTTPRADSRRLIQARILLTLAALALAFSFLTLMLGGWGEMNSIDSARRTAVSLWGADPSAASKITTLEIALHAVQGERDTREMLLRASGWVAWLALATTLNGLGTKILRGERRSQDPPGS
jgi:hypothetical protein